MMVSNDQIGGTHLNRVTALVRDSSHRAHCSWGKHDLVVVDQGVFVDGTKDVTACDVVADLEVGGVEVPLDFTVKRLRVDTTCST